ncbi:RibD family protein [Pseudonocardia nigra]|uniref:RibD family protein n=1 Tax=Pseudonocardia nigra TaxID=1921578 RepID=UPI0027E26640|nr:dihydrofolate reductase family protein [Pseudonocardia nigra]
MTARPYVLLSVATSVDGCIDDATPRRLVLSNAADLDRVDAERAGVDAILVGATTVRRDDPRLLVRSTDRVARRLAEGRPAQPTKVAVSRSGLLDPGARFFTAGDAERVVVVPDGAVAATRARLGDLAEVVGAGDPLDPRRVLAVLAGRGVRRLMVEGGTSMHTLFLTAGLVDEIQLVVAPFFVGDPAAPRFVGPGAFPYDAGHRMRLAEARPIGDVVLLRYLLGDTG